MKYFFEVQNLKVGFATCEGVKEVLNIEYLALEKGKSFGLVGESGAGKTVLAQTILGIINTPPGIIESGRIMLNGEDLLAKNAAQMRAIRGRQIAMIFQDPMSTLNPVFNVGTQITRVIRKNRGKSRAEAEAIALEKLAMVKIPDPENILRSYPHELSGGQRQRIIIAIALTCDAPFLIADEPTRNLDVTIQAGILKLLDRLQAELNMSMLFIANNLGLVSATCSRIGILHQGRIVEMGDTVEILRRPQHPYTQSLIRASSWKGKEHG